MRLEVAIDTISVEALPAGMTTAALQTIVAQSVTGEIRALDQAAASVAAQPLATAALSAAISQAISRRLAK